MCCIYCESVCHILLSSNMFESIKNKLSVTTQTVNIYGDRTGDSAKPTSVDGDLSSRPVPLFRTNQWRQSNNLACSPPTQLVPTDGANLTT